MNRYTNEYFSNETVFFSNLVTARDCTFKNCAIVITPSFIGAMIHNCWFVNTSFSFANNTRSLSNIEIRGCRFENCINPIRIRCLSCPSIRITDNYFHSDPNNHLKGNQAIHIAQFDVPNELTTWITGNIIDGVYSFSPEKDTTGIMVLDTGCRIRDNRIQRVTNSNNDNKDVEDIYVKSANAVIEGNECWNTGKKEGSICCKGKSHDGVRILNNTIHNAHWAIHCTRYVHKPIIMGNQIYNSHKGIIAVSKASIHCNQFTSVDIQYSILRLIND